MGWSLGERNGDYIEIVEEAEEAAQHIGEQNNPLTSYQHLFIHALPFLLPVLYHITVPVFRGCPILLERRKLLLVGSTTVFSASYS
jgi:hypothetical protein